jgi:hypothetical protein
MLALNRSLLNREYILMNVLKALASIICMCNLHVILLSNNTPSHFTLFKNGIFRPFNVRRESGGLFRRVRPVSQSQSQSYITTDSHSVSMSWCRAQSGTFDQRSYVFLFKVTVLSFGGALSDERSGLSFVSLCQYSVYL